MKKIILATLSVLYLVSYGQSKKKNDLTEENLKGKVKSIKETTYEAVDKFGQIEKGNVFYDRFSLLFNSPFTIIYNEKGNKIEKNYYNSDGSLKSKTTYKYDEKGNNIEENIYGSDGSLKSKTTYKYDKKGNNIEENTYDSDSRLNFKATYKYNEKGNIIEKNYYDSDGRLNFKATYKYDKKGNNIEYNICYSDGSLDKTTYKYKYEYDKNNNWTQQVTYENNKPTQITERIIEYYP